MGTILIISTIVILQLLFETKKIHTIIVINNNTKKTNKNPSLPALYPFTSTPYPQPAGPPT